MYPAINLECRIHLGFGSKDAWDARIPLIPFLVLKMRSVSRKPGIPGVRKARVGQRAQLACINCKARKQKVRGGLSSAFATIQSHRARIANGLASAGLDITDLSATVTDNTFALACFVEDPVTGRHQPRNYVETLEARIGLLEEQLRRSPVPRPSPLDTQRIDNLPACSDTQMDQTAEDDECPSELSNQAGMLGLLVDGEEPHYLGP
ncbi:unnamed protein product [Clonostachys rhizophaga]|uniref:Uncharacterized protein n=1 Tax=Clonostachys rhizophaga TaxID=160324 RepID=A0A9N9VJL6_9HYPO|nr:unnamed protein product [Clonostachys rhizophaga]